LAVYLPRRVPRAEPGLPHRCLSTLILLSNRPWAGHGGFTYIADGCAICRPGMSLFTSPPTARHVDSLALGPCWPRVLFFHEPPDDGALHLPLVPFFSFLSSRRKRKKESRCWAFAVLMEMPPGVERHARLARQMQGCFAPIFRRRQLPTLHPSTSWLTRASPAPLGDHP